MSGGLGGRLCTSSKDCRFHICLMADSVVSHFGMCFHTRRRSRGGARLIARLIARNTARFIARYTSRLVTRLRSRTDARTHRSDERRLGIDGLAVPSLDRVLMEVSNIMLACDKLAGVDKKAPRRTYLHNRPGH